MSKVTLNGNSNLVFRRICMRRTVGQSGAIICELVLGIVTLFTICNKNVGRVLAVVTSTAGPGIVLPRCDVRTYLHQKSVSLGRLISSTTRPVCDFFA